MTHDQWASIRYFKPGEFDSKDAPGSGYSMMEFLLVSRLDALRTAWGKPLIVTSGYRTLAHNTEVGGAKDSAHMRGYAADLRTNGLAETIRLGVLARVVGFTRIGFDLKGKLLHVDSDPSLAAALWFYNETALV